MKAPQLPFGDRKGDLSLAPPLAGLPTVSTDESAGKGAVDRVESLMFSGGRMPTSAGGAGQTCTQLVMRHPEQLRVHPVLEEFDFILLDELNDAERQNSAAVCEPVFITTDNTILSGFGLWRLAILQGSPTIYCLEYSTTEEETLRFVLRHLLPRRGCNAFVRICAALKLEPGLQQHALENMRAGGKCKGLAKLPNPQHIDVRQEIARAAGVGTRNVTNVKTILQLAHLRLIEALRLGSLTINAATQLCKLPKDRQFKQFARICEERATYRVIRQAIDPPKRQLSTQDFAALIEALRQKETRQPGSVLVRESGSNDSTVLIGNGLDVVFAYTRKGD